MSKLNKIIQYKVYITEIEKIRLQNVLVERWEELGYEFHEVAGMDGYYNVKYKNGGWQMVSPQAALEKARYIYNERTQDYVGNAGDALEQILQIVTRLFVFGEVRNLDYCGAEIL